MSHHEESAVAIDPKELARKIRIEYSRGAKDQTAKTLDGIEDLCRMLETPTPNVNEFIRKTADLISKQFGIASVAIATKDPVDGLFRYRNVIGMSEDVAMGFRNIVYKEEQLLDEKTYPSHEISSRTRMYLTEDHPYAEGEEWSYRHPQLIGMRRRTPTDSLEADYIDFFIYGQNKEIVGFIETSGTILRQLPDIPTIRWIELIASILGVALRTRK